MELLSQGDIRNIIEQLGYTEPINWSLKAHSDEVLGYLGEHLSLIVEVESGAVLKFFVKCVPRFEKTKADYIRQTRFFEKEYAVLGSLFKKFGQGTKKWRPTVYLVKEDIFVFEDVVELGYTILRNRQTLTLDEVAACIETMARFHAQSYIYEEKRCEKLGRSYRIWEDYSLYLNEPITTHKWRSTGMLAAIAFMKVYSKFKDHPNFSKNVEPAVQKLFDKALCLMEPSAYRNVVVHRDLWMNNIFFKNDGNTQHALFVDYQTVLYSSPMLDFSSFIYFNTRRDFRDNYLEKMLDLYYYVLSEELKASNIDITNVIDKETLNDCYKNTFAFGICQAALIVPISHINKQENENIFGDQDVLKKFYEESRSEEIINIARTDEKYRNHVVELFDEIVEKFVLVDVV